MAVACNREAMETQISSANTTSVPPAEGTLVKVDLEVSYPGSSLPTKAAMTEIPTLENLFLAIFSEDGGYLQNWIPMDEYEQPTAIGVNATAKYSVYLPITTNEIFHVIGNSPIEQPTFDYEEDFVESMVTDNLQGAYWQRIKIPGGIKAAKNAQGQYILDGNGNYTADYESLGDLKHIILVRNYAKIVVKSADLTEFDVLEYALAYYPTSGTVAPWKPATEEGGNDFNLPYTSIKNYLPQNKETPEVDYDKDLHRKGRFYEDLTLKTDAGYTGYSGIMPTDVAFNTDLPTTFVSSTAADNGLYMYERTVPNDTDQLPTVILMKVKWAAGNSVGAPANAEDWFKVELLDQEGEYMPVLRNIRYTLSLSGIKERGKNTAKAAFEGSALGNISSSLETAALNDISDGTSRILVEKLYYAFFTNIGNTTLEFQFYPDETSTTTVNKTGTYQDDAVTITITRRTVTGYESTPAVTEDVSEADVVVVTHEDGSQWGQIPLTIGNVPESGMLKSIIRVQGKYGSNRAIYREVTYEVMGQQEFTDETQVVKGENATDAMNQPVVVTIGLPSGLSAGIFPLQVRIEALDNNLSATDPNLPVIDGLSTFPAKKTAGKRSFYYIKTINFTDYRQYDIELNDYVYTTEFDCTLYTTKTSGNATTVRLSYNDDDESKWLFKAENYDLTF